jgi:hypothetical protein
MRSDWVANRDELMAFWKSCKYTTADLFADSLPWLFVRGYAGRLRRASMLPTESKLGIGHPTIMKLAKATKVKVRIVPNSNVINQFSGIAHCV